MPGCDMATCENTNRKTKGSDVKYFRFSQNEGLPKQWINAETVAIQYKKQPNFEVWCYAHFTSTSKSGSAFIRETLLDWLHFLMAATGSESRSVSPNAYNYLRTKIYPLPVLSTLKRWVSTFDFGQGNLKHLIAYVSYYLMRFTFQTKLTLTKKTSKLWDLIRLPKSTYMKQPIYYKFDQPKSNDILNEIISNLFHANFIVVAICSDMGAGNVGLWSKLDVGYSKTCSFNHPCDDCLKIFLIRNHLLDHRLVTDNGSVINIDYFQVLLNISRYELTFLAHKLTKQHLHLQGSMRQRVRPAAQLLSNTAAKAMPYCGENG
nr:unnamed protein product [Callosobruchus chinensis]